MLKTSDFDYYFPQELIAHEPAVKRDHSRLMVLERRSQTIEHKYFYDILDYLRSGDLLVLNDTRVIPANLSGVKEDGGAKVEVLLVKRLREQVWQCLVKPGKRLKVGSRVIFGDGRLRGEVREKAESGDQIIAFECQENFWQVINEIGKIPLPPYIKPSKPNLDKRYQTVFASIPGASAAPTAGLHFTEDLLEKIRAMGVDVAYVTLHTGLATFLPVRTENIEDHKMHAEYYEIPRQTLEALGRAKRVIAVGTTSVRALESYPLKGFSGETDLFIYPGFKFRVVKGMITNFHWPRSTLIMLVAAFAGKGFILEAYQEAIRQQYRFFSFGDAMLLL